MTTTTKTKQTKKEVAAKTKTAKAASKSKGSKTDSKVKTANKAKATDKATKTADSKKPTKKQQLEQQIKAEIALQAELEKASLALAKANIKLETKLRLSGGKATKNTRKGLVDSVFAIYKLENQIEGLVEKLIPVGETASSVASTVSEKAPKAPKAKTAKKENPLTAETKIAAIDETGKIDQIVNTKIAKSKLQPGDTVKVKKVKKTVDVVAVAVTVDVKTETIITAPVAPVSKIESVTVTAPVSPSISTPSGADLEKEIKALIKAKKPLLVAMPHPVASLSEEGMTLFSHYRNLIGMGCDARQLPSIYTELVAIA